MRLFIEPNDVLMFRDGRPFSGGNDHFARGAFPPPPSTIYGALRSHILSVEWSEFNKFASGDKSIIPERLYNEIGTPGELGTLTLRQFALAKKDNDKLEQYFPAPKDIVREKGSNNGKMFLLKPETIPSDLVMTNLTTKLLHLWHPTEQALENPPGFLSSEELKSYLLGNAPTNMMDSEDIYQVEERTGILKNRTKRSVETGGLYSVEYFRLKDSLGFSVELEGVTLLPEKGILRFGGDHRSAYYAVSSWDNISTAEIKKKVEDNNRFKVVLITPAIFENGWMPGGIDKNSMEGVVSGVKVKLAGACLGKPVGIGGFDLVKKMPKIMKKAVPAGSVYYFELKGSNVEAVLEKMWLRSISDERTQEGFGISLIGGY